MTREEAIEIIKRNCTSGSYLYEACEMFIPELRESEDERVRKEIIEYLKLVDKGEGDYAHPMVSGWIAWLEKQKEQKPEWSGDDEEMLNSCISSIEEAKENRYAYKETDGDTSYDHEISWLKSLRPQPHWKPSEWQMSMLLAVINDPNNAGSESCYLTLKSIYEQLKKL